MSLYQIEGKGLIIEVMRPYIHVCLVVQMHACTRPRTGHKAIQFSKYASYNFQERHIYVYGQDDQLWPLRYTSCPTCPCPSCPTCPHTSCHTFLSLVPINTACKVAPWTSSSPQLPHTGIMTLCLCACVCTHTHTHALVDKLCNAQYNYNTDIKHRKSVSLEVFSGQFYMKIILVLDWLICQTLSLSYSSKHSSNWSGENPLASTLCRASSNLQCKEKVVNDSRVNIKQANTYTCGTCPRYLGGV